MELKRAFKALGTCLIIAMLFTTACQSDKVYPPQIEGDVSYANDMQPFFNAMCTECHNGTGIPLNLLADVSYDALFTGNYVDTTDASASVLYVKIVAPNSMESYASDVQRSMTLKWIEQGAKNN